MQSKDKILSRTELMNTRNSLRDQGKTVGYTSGVFDVLHAGHVAYLEEAKRHCDILIVGINSDKSVRELKGPLRPICEAEQRSRVVAGLSAVDYVFNFDEQNNNQNISDIKPDRYIKAGDYSKDRLSSAALVEEYGGEVVLVQFEKGLSSTNVIQVITDRYAPVGLAPDDATLRPPAPAAFIDRDGTIIEHVEYLSDPDQVKVYPEAITGIKLLQDAGFRIIIVTNQAGIGLGYFSKEDFFRVNKRMLKSLSENGILVDKIYYSPASKADQSPYRKPATGMVQRAVQELNVDISRSVVFGDSTADIQLAANTGCRSVLLTTGNAGKDKLYPAKASFTASNMLEGARWILGETESNNAKVSLLHRPADDELALLSTLGTFGAKVGHDLNNLLASIQGCTDLIESRAKRNFGDVLPFQKQIEMLRKSIQKGKDLTTFLRGLVRSNAMPTEECVLTDLVTQALQGAQSTLGNEESISVEVDCDPSLTLNVNRFQTTRLIQALFTNALEAAQEDENPHVTVQASSKNGSGETTLCILNNGNIPDATTLGSLFEPFSSSKAHKVGTGFGLNMAMGSAIVHQIGGSFRISIVDNTFFSVELSFPT